MDTQEGSVSKKEIYKRWWFWVVVVIVLIIIGNLAGSSSSTPSVVQNAPSTESTASTTNSTEQSGPASTFGDGTFIVGIDIQSGTYRSSGGSNCYYARLSGFGGTDSDIIANNDTDSSAVVTIQPTDKGFTSQGCGTWTKISVSNTSSTKSSTSASASTQSTISSAQSSTAAQSSAATPSNSTYTTPSGAVVSQNGSVVQSPPAPPASWHTVETFSGQTQENTPTFTIQGSQWRIQWQETGSGYFGANAESPDGSNYCSIANLVGPGSDSTYCYTSGTYYVSVNTANSWTITVQDYY